MSVRRWGGLAIAALACFHLAIAAWFVVRNSQTYDEPAYYYSGYAALATSDFSVNVHHPPISKELAALPIFVLSRLHVLPTPRFTPLTEEVDGDPVSNFLYRSPLPFPTMMLLGRIPMVLCGVLTIVIVGRWAFQLWGMPGAVTACALAVTEPSFVAHSCLITPDIAVTLFVTLLFYAAWRYGEAPSWPRLALMGLALGGALGSKFSALAALPALALIAYADPRGWRLPSSPATPTRRSTMQTTVVVALACGIAILAVAALYGRQGLPFLRQGVVGQFVHVAQGHPAFLWGRISDKGWWYYYPVAFALKTPLPTLVLLLAALAVPRLGTPFTRRTALFLGVPILCVLGATIWGGVDIGVRYLLPAYPLCFIVAARVATMRIVRPAFVPLLVGGAVAANIVGILAVGPHLLASANAMAGGPVGLARALGDSNIDWGQDLDTLHRYMEREHIPAVYLSYFGTARPSDYGIRSQPLPSNYLSDEPTTLMPSDAMSLLAISVTNLQGVYLADRDLYAWLRDRTPIARLGWSIYVYDLSDDPRLHCRLADIYLKSRAADYAVAERRRCAS